MEGGSSGIRSFVRPVSPLSRMQQSSVRDRDRLHGHRRQESNRSRSPANHRTLASTVHRANRREPYGEEDNRDRQADSDLGANQAIPDGGIETRRIIVVQRSGQDGRENSEIVFERNLDKSQPVAQVTAIDTMVSPDKRYRHNNHQLALGRERRKMGNRVQRKSAGPSIDRASTCPIFLRLAVSNGGKHHSLSEFDKGRFPEAEMQMHTWIDCNLKELAEEVRFLYPSARRRGTRLHFAVVYADQRGHFRRRDLGVVIMGFVNNQQSSVPVDQQPQTQQTLDAGRRTADKHQFYLSDDSTVTLMEKHFRIGDYIDVAISQHVPGTLGGYAAGRQPNGPVTSSRTGANLI